MEEKLKQVVHLLQEIDDELNNKMTVKNLTVQDFYKFLSGLELNL